MASNNGVAPEDGDGPRCPLGFKGTPPVGHPSIPGLTKSTTTTAAAATATHSWNPATWSPPTLLALDAAFLLLCVAIAWYFPDIKRALGKADKSGSGKTQ